MIASVAFRNFRALRSAQLQLAPFNLVIGPSGSGKTSLIEAVLRLQSLARLPLGDASTIKPDRAEIEFRFTAPYTTILLRLGCASAFSCDLLEVAPPGAPGWSALKAQISRIRAYSLDHHAMAEPAARDNDGELMPNGANLAAVLARMAREAPAEFSALQAELVRLLPEFRSIAIGEAPGKCVELGMILADGQGGGRVAAPDLAQGTLFTLAMLAITYDPDPPSLVCFEEIDRGIHPRLLREIRDLFYRLSYPETCELDRPATQVIATTHSPFMVDLFRDHPEEVVITQKHGTVATFERLADRADVSELLREGSLGDIWLSGILGGVPEERIEEESDGPGGGGPGGS